MDFSNISTPAEYNEAAYLAHFAAKELLERLQLMNLQPQRIVDLGCGAGLELEELAQRFPEAEVCGIDVAQAFLAYGKKKTGLKSLRSVGAWIQADAGILPLPSHSVDLIFANLLLPWCAKPTVLLREWRRVLRPKGVLLFSCLGPDTFKEWQAVTTISFLPSLVDMHLVGDALLAEGFADPVLEVEELTLRFQSPEKHCRELEKSGMLAPLESAENLPLTTTFEVIYAHAFCPAVKGFKPDEQGLVKIPVSQLKK